jgi:hypothetical protein
MSKVSSKVARPAFPHVYTTRSGSRYVRSIEVIRSQAGRQELDRQLNAKRRAEASKSVEPKRAKD